MTHDSSFYHIYIPHDFFWIKPDEDEERSNEIRGVLDQVRTKIIAYNGDFYIPELKLAA